MFHLTTGLNKEVEQLYDEEKRLGQISIVFTVLAILISCLGLFGLVSYVAEQKKKEIGIRKVLGASISSVVQLLTKDFLKLVGIAFIIATPIHRHTMVGVCLSRQFRLDNYIVHSWISICKISISKPS